MTMNMEIEMDVDVKHVMHHVHRTIKDICTLQRVVGVYGIKRIMWRVNGTEWDLLLRKRKRMMERRRRR